MDDNYNDLIGDILKQTGMKDNIQSKNKPLPKNYFQMDVYQNFQKAAKDAGYLPPWLKLQKEISKLVHGCQMNNDVEIINEKIKEYNRICPPKMQKMLMNFNELDRAKRVWNNLD